METRNDPTQSLANCRLSITDGNLYLSTFTTFINYRVINHNGQKSNQPNAHSRWLWLIRFCLFMKINRFVHFIVARSRAYLTLLLHVRMFVFLFCIFCVFLFAFVGADVVGTASTLCSLSKWYSSSSALSLLPPDCSFSICLQLLLLFGVLCARPDLFAECVCPRGAQKCLTFHVIIIFLMIKICTFYHIFLFSSPLLFIVLCVAWIRFYFSSFFFAHFVRLRRLQTARCAPHCSSAASISLWCQQN